MVWMDLLPQTHMAKYFLCKSKRIGVRGFGTTLGLHTMFTS